jgi:hypothetical protein
LFCCVVNRRVQCIPTDSTSLAPPRRCAPPRITRVEAAEAAAARAVAAAERLQRDWRAVAASLSASMERYSAMTTAALAAEVGGDSRVVAALEGAEAAAAEANASVTSGALLLPRFKRAALSSKVACGSTTSAPLSK